MLDNPVLLKYMTESCFCFPLVANPQRETVYKATTSGVHYFTGSVVISPYDQSGQLEWVCSSLFHPSTRAVTSALGGLLIYSCNFQYLLDFHKEISKTSRAIDCAASNRKLSSTIEWKLYQLTQTALLKLSPDVVLFQLEANLWNAQDFCFVSSAPLPKTPEQN